MNNLIPKQKPDAPLLLKQNVINHLKQKEKMKNNLLIRRISIVAAVIGAIAIIIPISMTTNVNAQTRKTINAAVEKLCDINNYIVRFKMRTTPEENFCNIDANKDFVNGYFEKSFNQPYAWRISKQEGRTAIFNGDNVYMWNSDTKLGFSFNSQSQEGILEEFSPLLEPTRLLQNELLLLASNSSKATINKTGQDIVLVIESEAQGNFTNDYMLNKSISESYNRRTYIFDKKTKLLKSFCADIIFDGRYVTIVKSEDIAYNQPIDWSVEMKRPDIEWRNLSVDIKNADLSGITSAKAALIILNALEKSDINAVKDAFYFYSTDYIKDKFFGLKIISIGESFKSGQYPGEFIPIEVKLRDGQIFRTNLAIRNDNKNGVWLVDGGI